MNGNNEKQYTAEVFYAPLPVSEPQPILKPNKTVQLQNMVAPLAVTPYITFEGEENASASKEQSAIPVKVKKGSGGARICGFLMFLISAALLLPVINSILNNPVVESFRFFNIIDMWKDMVAGHMFNPKVPVVLQTYLISLGCLAVIFNLIKSLIAVVGGKRKGYAFCGFVVFAAFTAAALSFFGFDRLREISKILENKTALEFLVMAVVSLVMSVLFTAVCPKQRKKDFTEF